MDDPSITKRKVADMQVESEPPRYDVSIYNTPFSKLPDPKRVWLGSPSSTLEGLGR